MENGREKNHYVHAKASKCNVIILELNDNDMRESFSFVKNKELAVMTPCQGMIIFNFAFK